MIIVQSSLGIKKKKLRTTQGSPHLQKIGRLYFSLREHEEEVNA
jgi:hypothetical protein